MDPEHLRIMNTYFHYEMYLYRRRERLLPRRPVNAYFLEPLRKCTLRRYNAETTPVT